MVVDEDEGEDDPEIQVKLMRARAAVTEVSELRAITRIRLSGKSQERRHAMAAPAATDLPEVSGDPAHVLEAQRVQCLADSRKHAEEVAQSRAAKTSEDARKVQEGSSG